jgi:undecaprenyl-phosphate 4-deoxy-4-formamido-L-arabinose transferase
MKYSIVIPVYNAEETLPTLIEGIVSFFQPWESDFEIITIDDGSSDNSWNQLKNLKLKFPQVKAFRLAKNFGQHNATLCGILSSTGDFIITMDDDLQQSPVDIYKLIETQHKTGADIVYGIYQNAKHPPVKKAFGWFFRLISKLDKQSLGKGSSFRLLNGSMREKLSRHDLHFIFIDEVCLWYTRNISYVTVSHHPSARRKSGYTAAKLLSVTRNLVIFSSDIPLRIIIYGGFFIAGINGIIGTYYLYRRLFFDVPLGFTSLIVSILFSTGIILICLGVIGFYLGQLYKIANKQPSYSIDEQI